MSHKKFILLFFIISFFIFCSLPIFNYINDQWRVLHKDFHTYYEGIEPNKSFLKVAYLLENKNKYEGLAFSSSRLGNIDLSNFSNNMYNATYSFGHINSHLKNIKILLENGVKIKRILLGVDDFYIYEKGDFDKDYLRKPYETDFFKKLEFYKYYLFKKPQKRDFDIFLNKYPLIDSFQITNPNNIEFNKNMAKKYLQDSKHKERLIKAETENMEGKTFYTDYSIKKIKELKELCKQNKIELIIFFNPTYYKLYLSYNQNEIERFKRKLVKISSFHDFYFLENYTLDENNWFDFVHYFPNVGVQLVEKLKSNKYLVKKEDIDEHLLKIRKYIRNLLNKKEIQILKFNFNIPFNSLKKSTFKSLKKEVFKVKSENLILSFKIDSLKNSTLKIKYGKSNIYKVNLQKGNNQFNLLIKTKFFDEKFISNIFSNANKNFKIKELYLYY